MKRFFLLTVVACAVLSGTSFAMDEREKLARTMGTLFTSLLRLTEINKAEEIWKEVGHNLETTSQHLKHGEELRDRGQTNEFKRLLNHMIKKQTKLIDTLTEHQGLINTYINSSIQGKNDIYQMIGSITASRYVLMQELKNLN
ncbi:MAG: hypothetical protein WCE21_03020 [Candidatus Babeliales bacterium]